MPKFVALDIETANPDLSSICQIGLVAFEKGEVVQEWTTYVDPCDYFHRMNIAVHGITEERVAGAPRFSEVMGELSARLTDQVVVAHGSFDRMALSMGREKYSLPDLSCTWLDTTRVVRRCWPQFRSKGYGLKNVATWCGIEFDHHDAGNDARAAGLILLRALSDSGTIISDWVVRAVKPIDQPRGDGSAQVGDPDAPLAGEVVVFTGALAIPRREAADKAAACGCTVAATVTKLVTLVVVGDQDIQMLSGHEKSAKHRKAEELMGEGQPIRIIGESDFFTLLQMA